MATDDDVERPPRHRRRKPEIQLPWSTEGWATNAAEASRDNGLDQELGANRGVVPATLAELNRPGLAINPAMNNPYLAGALGIPLGWLAAFLYSKLSPDAFGWAIATASFFGFSALLIVGLSAWRIPAWHRARRVGKAWIRQHGGELPSELRWYN
jgi:hypothetical protein